MAATLKHSLQSALQKVSDLPIDTLLARRYQKFRRIGVYEELAVEAAEKSPPDTSADGPAKNNGK
jgi:hypothetical protein